MLIKKYLELLNIGSDEAIGTYAFTGDYDEYSFIIPKDQSIDRIDIAGCIEETLHRILNNGGKHKAAVSKANAKKAAEKRKANAEKKDKVKTARLLAKKETGHILTLVEQDTLAKLQKKYNKKK